MHSSWLETFQCKILIHLVYSCSPRLGLISFSHSIILSNISNLLYFLSQWEMHLFSFYGYDTLHTFRTLMCLSD